MTSRHVRHALSAFSLVFAASLLLTAVSFGKAPAKSHQAAAKKKAPDLSHEGAPQGHSVPQG